ncbi:hypothetical protein [Enterococcus sp. 5B3_DIV0040]|uniref:hypothetical protein n=1 Tax=Enterococcus sp. 5B3_DIV0040 TaxID=1834182 RepID=UPI000A357883|nr:hypothetical protein [Enterococcus sp. 5B3_DIV0040]OTO05374.1 hypothetical protein A5883_002367 [Enterococcus sp. 5B3_DIV0040]
MDRKQIKQRQKEIRTQIQNLIDSTPNWSRLPDDAPEVEYARKLQKEVERLGKMRPYRKT